jgi:hypothetical protein
MTHCAAPRHASAARSREVSGGRKHFSKRIETSNAINLSQYIFLIDVTITTVSCLMLYSTINLLRIIAKFTETFEITFSTNKKVGFCANWTVTHVRN